MFNLYVNAHINSCMLFMWILVFPMDNSYNLNIGIEVCLFKYVIMSANVFIKEQKYKSQWRRI